MSAEETMPQKILVADDEEHIRQALQACLESAGYAVFTAENGKRAVELAKLHKPQLALLDVRMPVMDGHMASIELRYDEELKGIKFMFLTANADEDSKDYAFGHGAEEYMLKPFKVAELLAKVAKVLGQPEAEAEPAKHAPAKQEEGPEPQLSEEARQRYLEKMKQKFSR
jgi:two-component system alkaline phosphatase synthesis response regulator PhoP